MLTDIRIDPTGCATYYSRVFPPDTDIFGVIWIRAKGGALIRYRDNERFAQLNHGQALHIPDGPITAAIKKVLGIREVAQRPRVVVSTRSYADTNCTAPGICPIHGRQAIN